MAKYIKTTKCIKTLIVSCLLILLFFVLSGCDLNHSNIKEKLKYEFGLIPTLSDATVVEQKISDNTEVVRISVIFNISHSYNEVIDYYDAKLREYGWQFYKEEKLYGWGEDLGGNKVIYKKNDLVAILQYAGEKANYGWDYNFSIGWGDARYK